MILDAINLLVAAIRNVKQIPGSARRNRSTSVLRDTLCSKNVIAGLSVRTKLAE